MVETKSKKKAKRKVSSGVAHIKASFNNTIILLVQPGGGIALKLDTRHTRNEECTEQVKTLPLFQGEEHGVEQHT